MHVEIYKGNILDSDAEAIILTVDGMRKGLEGNVSRAFERMYPELWEELQYEFKYPISSGFSKIYSIDPIFECTNKFCILASTLNHIEILDNKQKLKVISSALTSSLALASRNGVTTICSCILSGGWRLELIDALIEMLKTFERYKKTTIRAPVLKIYIIGNSEYSQVEKYLKESSFELRIINGILVI